MAVASKAQRAVTDVSPEGWARFGRILQDWREDELGYQTRAAFARDRGINIRLVQDLEKNYRPGTYTKWALEDAEDAYQVTRESLMAVLYGAAGMLVRAEDAPARQPAEPVAFLPRALPPPPFDDPAREAADRPYAVILWERILDLPHRVSDPSASHLDLAGDDAKVWNGTSSRLGLSDRVWLIAELQRREAAREDGRSGDGRAG